MLRRIASEMRRRLPGGRESAGVVWSAGPSGAGFADSGGRWRLLRRSALLLGVAAVGGAGAAAAAPPPPVGRLVVAWPAGGDATHPVLVGRCVVTPVAPRVVVTDAPCLGIVRRQGVLVVGRPSRLRIVLGYANVASFTSGADDRRLFRIVGVAVSRTLEPLDVGQDVAYLTLDRPTSVPPLAVVADASTLTVGVAAESYGWTWSAAGRITAATRLRRAAVTLADATTPIPAIFGGFYVGSPILVARATPPKGSPVYDGSPLIIAQPAGPAVAGVAVGTFNDCRSTSRAWGAAFAPLAATSDPATRVAFPALHGGIRYIGRIGRGRRLTCAIDPRDATNPDLRTTYTWTIHTRSLIHPERATTRLLYQQTMSLPGLRNEYEFNCSTTTRSLATSLATTMASRSTHIPVAPRR